jgi:hypothetical protein
MQFLLATLMLHIDRLPQHGELDSCRSGGEIYARFHAELERSYPTTRRAEDYAARLGYTVMTRTCLAASGQPVKTLIDVRVALQAQRLLAHTGGTPGEFRRVHRDQT